MAGYSIGGLIGFEVARRLIAEGEEVAYLAGIEADLPGVLADDFFPGRREAYRRMLATRDLRGASARLTGNVRRRLEAQAVRRLGVRPSARQIDENVRLAMVDAFCSYEGAPLDVAIELFVGTDNDEGDVDAIVAGWERLALGGVHLCRVPGWHDTILVPPAVDAVAVGMRRSMEASEATRPVLPSLPASAEQPRAS